MAILGIGVDVVDIGRFDRLVERWGERVLDRLFTPVELEYGMKKGRRESLAGTFAAKEAFVKALGGRWTLSWKDMEVLRDGSGRPLIRFDPSKVPFRVWRVHLSISHDGGYAMASCVVEGEP